MKPDTTQQGDATELLQGLIRNRCVNDGTPDSGHETRNAELLEAYLTHPALEIRRHEAHPDRGSIVARLPGRDPGAQTLLLLSHLDVVPAGTEGWDHDPFGADLVDGVVWGRGAIDMFNLTASMAVALRRLADGPRLRGSIVFVGAADEEAGGNLGTGWLVDHEAAEVRADYVITEWGGVPVPTPAGPRLWVMVGEKGLTWVRLTVRGTPGHASRPFGSDNAIVTAAEVVRRLAAYRGRPVVDHIWAAFVDGMAFPPDITAALHDPARIWDGISALKAYMAQRAHAASHMTIAPTVIHGGTKTNVIPESVEIDLDIRSLPGQSLADVEEALGECLGDLGLTVEVAVNRHAAGSVSPTETPLWTSLERAVQVLRPDAVCLPTLTTGSSDARYFRERGVPAYGFGLFSDRISIEDFGSMFHGRNERIDQESLRLSVALWEGVATDLLA